MTPLERFQSKFTAREEPNSCHVWTGGKSAGGYGRFTINRKEHLAHRLAWEWANGPIPDEMCVCHDCPGGDNPSCVNPAHMFLGTRAENVYDSVRKGTRARGERHGTKTKPERVARGLRSARYTKPERTARGDRHGMRLHPASVPRAEKNGMSRLTWDRVRAIRARYAAGGISQTKLAEEFGIDQTTVSRVVLRQTWTE